MTARCSKSISPKKGRLRRDAVARRDALPADVRKAAAEAIAARSFPLAIAPGTIVSGFMPLKSEINPLPLMQKLSDAGARLALPAIAGRGKPLIMRDVGIRRAARPRAVGHPRAEAATAPEVEPDILLVPLLAFDRAGYRIGYGAGYYDMTINRLRTLKTVTAVGIAFAAQEIAKGADDAPRRAARSRANRARGDRPSRPGFQRPISMRILFVGDVVGRSGRTIVYERLPGLIRDWKLDLVVVNGENAAGGFGITETIYRELIDAGADAITLGNHAWDQREALVFIERAECLIRPINYPAGTPGRGAALIEAKNGERALVVNAMGRIFMDALDDPFAAVDRELAPARSAGTPKPSSSTSTARRRARSSRWDFSATAARASWSAPIRTRRRRTIASCPAAPPSSATSA